MAKLINGRRQIYEPPGQDEVADDARVRFHIRPPSVYDRARHHRATARLGATLPANAVLFARAREALAEIFGPDDPDRLALEAAIGRLDDGDPLPADRDDYDRLEQQLIRHDDGYAGLVADRAFWLEVAPLEAVRLFVTGWDNLSPPYRAGPEGVHADVLAELAREHPDRVALAGFHILSLMRPSEAEAKNSASPSGGDRDPATSPAASTPAPTAPLVGGDRTAP
jgi:hypothetical protein